MAAGGSDPRTADVEEDASQLVFPKGASGAGAGAGWWLRPAAAAREGPSLVELGALLNAPAPPAATKPQVLKIRIINYLYKFKDLVIARIWRFLGGPLRVRTVLKKINKSAYSYI